MKNQNLFLKYCDIYRKIVNFAGKLVHVNLRKKMRERKVLKLIAAMMLAIMFVACSEQKGENKTSTLSKYEEINAQAVRLLSQNPDSVFIFVDSLEATGKYPECVINLIRGNDYARLGSLRFAEFYLRKAIGDELHKIWPRGYYNGQYNLSTSLMMKGNLEEAMKLSQAANDELTKETDPKLKIWEPSLLFIVGSCQLALHQIDEANKTMQKCYDQLMHLATTDTTHVTMEMIGTTSSNIATSYYNDYPDKAMPWIERAEKAFDMLAEHNRKSKLLSMEPVLRAKMLMVRANCYASNGKLREAKEAYDKFMASPYANNPIILIEQLSYLEKTNQWDAAADMLEPIAQFHDAMGLDYTMDNLSNVAESYRVYEKAGRHADAVKMAQQMANMVDSVSLYQQKDDAAELAVIYATQEKDQQIAQQEAKLSRQRLITNAIVSGIIILALAIFIFFRHRAAKRLEVAHEKLKDAYDKLEETTAAKERMASELRIARDIQMSMVPSVFPEREGLDMFAQMTPAKEVGGDLYGYVLTGEKLYFAIGDVSGKGVPASLFMAQATRLFRTLAAQGMMPAEICTRMNAALTEDNQQGMFITFFLGLLDLQSGHLSFCNAGHNPPVIGGGENHGDFLDMKPNAPIGLWEGLEYEGEEISTIKDRPFFLYTDGLNEAEDTEQNQFGEERMLDILRQTSYDSAKQVIETLTNEIEKHRNGAEPNDDLTMFCIHVS